MQQPEDDPLQWQYVATQGPLPHTVHTFWHMVVEQQCSAIVMLTEVAEGNATKCCQYFPQRTGDRLQARFVSGPLHRYSCFARGTRRNTRVSCAKNHVAMRLRQSIAAACSRAGTGRLLSCDALRLQEDDVTVECVSLEMLGVGRLEIEKRMMRVTLTSTGSAFVCAHYLMLTWPDHGAPTETHSIQELVRAVNDVRLRALHMPDALVLRQRCFVHHAQLRTCVSAYVVCRTCKRSRACPACTAAQAWAVRGRTSRSMSSCAAWAGWRRSRPSRCSRWSG